MSLRLLAVQALAVTLASACTATSGTIEASPDLVWVNSGSGVVEGQGNTHQGDKFSDALLVCLSESGSIEVTSIEPKVVRGSVDITSFATRANPAFRRHLALTLYPRPFEKYKFPDSATVDRACTDSEGSMELGFGMTRTSEEDVYVERFLIHYMSKGESKTTDASTTILLCDGPVTKANKSCTSDVKIPSVG